jgi:hypothetical protein
VSSESLGEGDWQMDVLKEGNTAGTAYARFVRDETYFDGR